MKQNLTLAITGLLSAAALTACIDDDYDLSDIDTTVQVHTTDLVLPINIDEIYLKDAVNPDGTSICVIDGKYCVNLSGEFHSDDITLDPILVNKPSIDSSTKTMDLSGASEALSQGVTATLPLPDSPGDFDYYHEGVTADIKTLDAIGTSFDIDINLSFKSLESVLKQVTYQGLVLQVPKGLTVVPDKTDGTYDPQTGFLTVGDRTAPNGKTTIKVTAVKIDQRAGYNLSADHVFTFSDQLSIVAGNAVISAADLTGSPSALPATAQFCVDFDMSQIDITSFSGTMEHDISGFDIPDVDLSILPDLLAQDSTDIRLYNPQLYIDFNNPAGPYNLSASTGLSITPYRGSVASATATMDAGTIVVPATATATEMVQFCLSPQQPESFVDGFNAARWLQYNGLGNILSGAGIPDRLAIALVGPELGLQSVQDFPVGRSIGDVRGEYTFFTPLELAAGSRLVYSDTITGWASEDLDALTITGLHVKANLSTDFPMNISFYAYPIDRDGRRIGNVSIEGADVAAYSTDHPLDVYITGDVTGLDGICFVATIKNDSLATLSENLYIKLTDIRVIASAVYTKEL